MVSSGENRRYYQLLPDSNRVFYNALDRYFFKFLLAADGTLAENHCQCRKLYKPWR